MKHLTFLINRNILAGAGMILLVAACSAPATRPEGAMTARNKLTQLQADPQLASRAPIEIQNAELAVRAAEVPQKDQALSRHLVVMADSKVEIARARAQSRLYEDQRQELSEQSEAARLESRTREADLARRDANISQLEADRARNAAADARIDTDIARGDAAQARQDTEAARRLNDELQQQIIELNARETERGLVVTLGDVLFETGQANLKGGIPDNLETLATFLNKYSDRTVIIEGHTDDIGEEDYNVDLSQRRADSVMAFLVSKGVASSRMTTLGRGESSPVADNASSTGRQLNRRVEVIISNTSLSSI